MGVSLWLAYQFRPGQVIYNESDPAGVNMMGVASVKILLGGKDMTWPASEVFLGLAGVFALLMVALAITQWRRAKRKAK